MSKSLTEDEVRDEARQILNMDGRKGVRSGVGQLTTFNQLGFPRVSDKPDGWYLPDNKSDVALILEAKASGVALRQPQVDELLKNIRIVQAQYPKAVGVLYNGVEARVFKGAAEYKGPGSDTLQNIDWYLNLMVPQTIDKEHIYAVTARINNLLHFQFGIKNLYHRMIFTACALVAERYGAMLKKLKGVGYAPFSAAITNTLDQSLAASKQQNAKIQILLDEYSKIDLNSTGNQQAIDEFIDCVADISQSINSSAWHGEDVMGIFFNEFNRYKKKSEAGQVFTPEHITDFMYRILDVGIKDKVLDAACGSGGFLVKAMSNMIHDAGGPKSIEASKIKGERLFGIEFDKEIYALACANMLIHKDGKTNLEQMDSRTEEAGNWIKAKKPTKVLMNPPFENKYGCMDIVANVLSNVPEKTICAFILPDKKLEKSGKEKIRRLLANNRLLKIIKLPEDLFFGVGVTTSVFVFEAGKAQNDEEIFACWMKEDGLQTVKNKGRHDVKGRWPAIERHWVEVVKKQSGDPTCQWIKPEEHLSYQVPPEPFRIFEEDFRKTAMDRVLFERGMDAAELSSRLSSEVMYGGPLFLVTALRNWDFMDTYMTRIMKEEEAWADELESRPAKRHEIDSSDWRGFRIGDLFEKLKLGILKPDFNKALDVSEVQDSEFSLPLVNAKHGGNGIMFYGREKDFESAEMTLDIVQNGAIATGDVYAQPQRTGVLWDAYLVKPKDSGVTKNALFFLAAVVERSIKQRFSWADKCTWEKASALLVKLPAKPDGTPDYAFMDAYMGRLMKEEDEWASRLTDLVGVGQGG